MRIGVGDGCVHDVSISNVIVDDRTHCAFCFVGSWGKSGQGVDISDISISHVQSRAARFCAFRSGPKESPAKIENITFADVAGADGFMSEAIGSQLRPIEGLRFKDVRLAKGIRCEHVRGLRS